MKKNRNITIKDVARLADVSISTVSRVLNNPDMVQSEKRERVERAIEELNFIPNPMARNLIHGDLRTVAVIVTNIMHDGIGKIVEGISSVFQDQDIDMLLFSSEDNPRMERKHYQYLTKNLVDGVIFVSGCGAFVNFDRIVKVMPVVLVDREERYPTVDTINVDERQGMETLYGHLLDQGHKRIGLLAGDIRTKGGMRRIEAFKSLVEAQGKIYDRNDVEYSLWSYAGGRDSFERLLQRKPDLTAIICASDVLAIGAMGKANDLGYAIPDDLALTGFDNFPIGEHLSPSMTTLSFPHQCMGEMAAQAILDRYARPDKPGTYQKLPLHLIARSSTKKKQPEEV